MRSRGNEGTTGFPEIRSVPGAMFVFSVALYPYVYLLARTAFLSRTASMIDAARSLGLTPWQTWWQVNLPLARPAIAAGALLALMETLAGLRRDRVLRTADIYCRDLSGVVLAR